MCESHVIRNKSALNNWLVFVIVVSNRFLKKFFKKYQKSVSCIQLGRSNHNSFKIFYLNIIVFVMLLRTPIIHTYLCRNFMETSAKNGNNVNEIFLTIAQKLSLESDCCFVGDNRNSGIRLIDGNSKPQEELHKREEHMKKICCNA